MAMSAGGMAPIDAWARGLGQCGADAIQVRSDRRIGLRFSVRALVGRAALLRQRRRRGLLLGGYFLEIFAACGSAVVRRIPAQSRMIVDHDAIRVFLWIDDNVETAD